MADGSRGLRVRVNSERWLESWCSSRTVAAAALPEGQRARQDYGGVCEGEL